MWYFTLFVNTQTHFAFTSVCVFIQVSLSRSFVVVVFVGFLFLLLLLSRSVYSISVCIYDFSSLVSLLNIYLFSFFSVFQFSFYLFILLPFFSLTVACCCCYWCCCFFSSFSIWSVCMSSFFLPSFLACCALFSGCRVQILTSDLVLLERLKWIECMSDRTCNTFAYTSIYQSYSTLLRQVRNITSIPNPSILPCEICKQCRCNFVIEILL